MSFTESKKYRRKQCLDRTENRKERLVVETIRNPTRVEAASLSKPVRDTATTINVDLDLNNVEVNTDATGRDRRTGGSLKTLDTSKSASDRNPGSGVVDMVVDMKESEAWASRAGPPRAIPSRIGTGADMVAKTTGIENRNLVTDAVVGNGGTDRRNMKLRKESMKDTSPASIPRVSRVSGPLSASADIEARAGKAGHKVLAGPSVRDTEVN
jgi:hypothetical protein